MSARLLALAALSLVLAVVALAWTGHLPFVVTGSRDTNTIANLRTLGYLD